MTRSNKLLVNTVGGELSPLMYGRVDLPIYSKGLGKCENFITLPQGGARFRSGTMFVRYTRLNQSAVLIPFQFSDQQAYLLEFTDKKVRFYQNNSIITESAKTITAMTNASPGLFTSVAHGYAIGDEVYITGLAGPSGINGKFYLIAAAGFTVNTFTLTDIFGTVIDTTTSGAYVSGGTASRVYEITSPYLTSDLSNIQFAQSADVMYLANNNYEPYRLTRQGNTNWSLQTYVRTNNQFASSTKVAATVTNAAQGVIGIAAHGLANNVRFNVAGATGMTQLNGGPYFTSDVTTNDFKFKDINGVYVNTSTWGVYGGSSGTLTLCDKFPACVAFTDSSRLVFAGTRGLPQTFWASKAPTTGGVAFDDFTTGTAATDAVFATITPTFGKVDNIQWISSTNKFLTLGTFSTVRRLYGATEAEPFSPTDINVKAVNNFGAAPTRPVSNGGSFFYIQRGGLLLRSLEYDLSVENYTTVDRNLVAEHLAAQGFKQAIEQQGTPDVVWVVRYDGKVVGLTYKEKEDISGWHRHYLGGRHVNTKSIVVPFGKVLSAGNMLRPSLTDQLWFVVERQINGRTVRSVEYVTDVPMYQVETDFNSVPSTDPTGDYTKFTNALYETQKDACHLDMAAVYDGTATGTAALANITLSAATGTGITITASSAVFSASMVGREIWKQYDTSGNGGGRARITAYTSPTQVTADVIVAFNNVIAIPYGNWFLTASSVSGLDHLEGETVSVVLDGGTGASAIVTGGGVSFGRQISKAIVGFPYRGTVETLNLDSGGILGPAEGKVRSLIKAGFRFSNTVGAKFGTSIYKLQGITFQSTGGIADRPPPPFTGLKTETYSDSWEESYKKVIVVQDSPLPCVLIAIDMFMDTADDQ